LAKNTYDEAISMAAIVTTLKFAGMGDNFSN
jgi:hypothetical protein